MTADRPVERRLTGWIILAVLNCAVIIPWLASVVPQPRDFNCLYTGAQVYRHNPGRMLYDLRLQARTEHALWGFDDSVSSKFFLPYNHSPYELILLLPLTSLSYHPAFWSWRIMSVGLLVLTAWLLGKVPELGRPPHAIFVMLLAFFPVGSSLMSGQDTALTLALFAAVLWCLRTGKHVYAGIFLGLGLFKLQLVLPIVGVYMLCRSWRVLAGFAVSAASVVGISTAMVGLDGMRTLLRLWLNESGILFCIRPALMPNIRGLLTNLSSLSAHSVTLVTAILSFLLLILAAHETVGIRSPERGFALSLCFVALVSFHTNVYDLSILIMPILLLLEMLRESRGELRCIALPPVFLLFCTPVYVLAAAAVKIGLLAVIVAWLWWALVVVAKKESASAVVAGRLRRMADPLLAVHR